MEPSNELPGPLVTSKNLSSLSLLIYSTCHVVSCTASIHPILFDSNCARRPKKPSTHSGSDKHRDVDSFFALFSPVFLHAGSLKIRGVFSTEDGIDDHGFWTSNSGWWLILSSEIEPIFRRSFIKMFLNCAFKKIFFQFVRVKYLVIFKILQGGTSNFVFF